MIVDNLNQIYNFTIALVVGAAMGTTYDIFKVIRLVGVNSKIAVFFQDILFFLIATVTLFSFYMQFTDGKFRIYCFVAAALGFWIYFKTIEKPIFFVIKKIYNFFVKIFGFVYRKITLPVLKIIKKLSGKVFSFTKHIIYEFFLQKIFNFFKNLLPKKRIIVYNNQRISKRRKRRGKDAGRRKSTTEKAFFG